MQNTFTIPMHVLVCLIISNFNRHWDLFISFFKMSSENVSNNDQDNKTSSSQPIPGVHQDT